MIIPSQASFSEEGVETRRQTPILYMGEGIVQLTNLKKVAKAIVRSITDWSLVQIQPVPQSEP
jgi:hypothetical protein